MSDPVFDKVSECFKNIIESSDSVLSPEEMKDASGKFSTIIRSYNELLNHHDLSCKTVREIVSQVPDGDFYCDNFSATSLFKDKLQELQTTHKNKNYCSELEKLIKSSGVEKDVEVCYGPAPGVQLDPYSQMPIEKPGKSSKCNHLFEYRTIMRMFSRLKANKRTLKCPHVGCTAVLTENDIEEL